MIIFLQIPIKNLQVQQNHSELEDQRIFFLINVVIASFCDADDFSAFAVSAFLLVIFFQQ